MKDTKLTYAVWFDCEKFRANDIDEIDVFEDTTESLIDKFKDAYFDLDQNRFIDENTTFLFEVDLREWDVYHNKTLSYYSDFIFLTIKQAVALNDYLANEINNNGINTISRLAEKIIACDYRLTINPNAIKIHSNENEEMYLTKICNYSENGNIELVFEENKINDFQVNTTFFHQNILKTTFEEFFQKHGKKFLTNAAKKEIEALHYVKEY